jgi:hypothetical protein
LSAAFLSLAACGAAATGPAAAGGPTTATSRASRDPAPALAADPVADLVASAINGNPPPITNVSQGQIDIPGNTGLCWGYSEAC